MDLGQLYFDILLNDKTNEQIESLKAKILSKLKGEIQIDAKDTSKLQADLDGFFAKYVGKVNIHAVDSGTIQSEIDAILAKYKANVDVSIKATDGGSGKTSTKEAEEDLQLWRAVFNRIQLVDNAIVQTQQRLSKGLISDTEAQNTINMLSRISTYLNNLYTNRSASDKTAAQNFINSLRTNEAQQGFERLSRTIKNCETAIAELEARKIKGILGTEGEAQLLKYQDLIARIKDFRDNGDVANLLNASQIKGFTAEYAKLNQEKKKAVAQDKVASDTSKRAEKSRNDEAVATNKVTNSLQQLVGIKRKLDASRNKANILDANSTQINRALFLYRQLMTVMTDGTTTAVQKMQQWKGALAAVRTRINNCLAAQTATNREAEQLARAAGKGAGTARQEVSKLSKELNRTTEQTSILSQALRGLAPVIGDVFSVYAVQRFLSQVVAVGGEIQKQRMALGHILGNESNANTLFGQMKDLAVKSPFGLLDLMQNARQLSAFGVEYNRLYDTMKRLSDVAAGLGIQFGRLSLAYGETMERGFLDGKIVRQFSYMGLPVLQEIAKYYTEINKAGNGQIFSAMDVRKMVSERAVSFADVDAVIQRLTDPELGGKFANMQEVMAESVAGKWKNVKDAIDILYSDIAEGNSELLKAPAEIIMSVIKNYEQFEAVLAVVAMRLIGTRAASLLFTTTMGAQTAAVYKEMLAERQAEVQTKLRTAAMNGQSMARLKIIAGAKQMTAATLSQMAADKGLTAEQTRLLATRLKVNKANATYLYSQGLITEQVSLQILQGNRLTATYGIMRGKLQILGMQAKLAAVAFNEMTMAMLRNPMTRVMGAVTALMELWMYIGRVNEEHEKLQQGMNERRENARQDAAEITARVTVADGGTIAEYQTAIETLTKFIKDDVPGSNEILKKAFELSDTKEYVHSVEERYRILKEYYDRVKGLLNDTGENDVQDAVLASFNSAWYAPNDSLLTDLSDYEKNYKNAKDNLVNAIANGNKELQEMLSDWRHIMGADSNSDLIEKLLAPANSDKLKMFIDEKRFKNNVSLGSAIAVPWSVGNLRRDYDEYISELEDCMNDLETRLKVKYGAAFTLGTANEEQKRSIAFEIRSYLDSSEMSDWAKEHMVDTFRTKWNFDISVGFEGDKDGIDFLKARFGSYAKDDIAGSHDEMRDQYKKAKKALDDLRKSTLKGFKTGADGLYGITPDKDLNNDINEANGYLKKLKELEDMAKREGLNLNEDENKNKGSQKDALLERMKTRLDQLKDAYAEFEKWSKVLGKDKAGEKIQKALGLDKDTIADVSDPKAYLAAIKKFEDSIKGFANGSEQRKKFLESVKKLGLEVELKIDNDEIAKFAADLKDKLSEAAKRYDIFKSWFDLTGNKVNAMNIALNIQPQWNDKSRMLLDAFNEKAVDLGIRFTEDNFPMYDKSMLDELFVGEKAGLKEAYIQVRDAFRDGGYDAAKEIANTLKGAQTYAEKVAVINEKYDRLTAGTSDPYTKGRLEGLRKKELDAIDPQRIQFFTAVTSLTKDAARQIGDAIKKDFVQQLENGSMSLDEFNKNMKKWDSTMKESENRFNSLFGALMSGGKSEGDKFFQSRIDAENAKIKAILDKAEAEQEGGLTPAQQEELDLAKQKVEDYTKERDAWNDFMKGLQKTVNVLNLVSGALDGFQKMFGILSDMYDALGNENLANKFSDIADGISAVTSSLSGVSGILSSALKGDVSGVISNAITAPVQLFAGPITAFSKLADKGNQREIELSQYRNKLLENTYSLLENRLSRTMGGVYKLELDGDTLAKMRNIQYGGQYSESTKKQAEQAEKTNSYYDAQLANLMAQRDELQKQRSEEADKKKSDKNALAEYDKSIAEMQDKIDNFAMDMAMSLYDIDFKDWASQLTDSIVEAWENGEDAAEAYGHKVKEIMKGVATNFIAQSIMEKALGSVMKPFLKKFKESEGKLSQNDIIDLAAKVNGTLDSTVAVVESVLDNLEAAGAIEKKTESKDNTLSSSIKNISEEQADRLGSYVNAIRMDVSVNRQNFETFMKENIGAPGEFGGLNAVASAQLRELRTQTTILRTIADNTASIANLEESMNGIVSGETVVRVR